MGCTELTRLSALAAFRSLRCAPPAPPRRVLTCWCWLPTHPNAFPMTRLDADQSWGPLCRCGGSAGGLARAVGAPSGSAVGWR